MRAVTRRVAALENRIWSAGRPRERFRMIVSRRDARRCLDGASCKRSLCSNGLLMEVIRLNKCDARHDDLTDEQLDLWVGSQPIEGIAG